MTNGCEQLHTEVFRAESLEHVVKRAQSFFSLMPCLEVESEDDRDNEKLEAAEENGYGEPLVPR